MCSSTICTCTSIHCFSITLLNASFQRPVWGVPFGSRGMSYITANGPSEFGLISYAENGEGTYQVEPPPGSSRPSTPLPLAPVPLPTATTSEQSAPIQPAEIHEQSLPLFAPDISGAGAYHVLPTGNYVLQVMDPQYPQLVVTYAWPGPSYSPSEGHASPSANLWAGPPVAGHAYGFPAPSDVDGRQSTHGSVLGDMSPANNSWANSPFTGHASPNGSFPASSPPCSPYSPPHVHNSASPGSWSGSPSSPPSNSVQEDLVYATQGMRPEPQATTSTRPNGGTFLS